MGLVSPLSPISLFPKKCRLGPLARTEPAALRHRSDRKGSGDETVAVCRQPVDCCQTLPPRWRLLSESTRPPPFLELSHPLRLVSQHQPPHGLQGPVAYVSATHNMIISKISTFCKSEMLSNRLFSISCDSAIFSPDHKAFSFVSETEGLNQAAATS